MLLRPSPLLLGVQLRGVLELQLGLLLLVESLRARLRTVQTALGHGVDCPGRLLLSYVGLYALVQRKLACALRQRLVQLSVVLAGAWIVHQSRRVYLAIRSLLRCRWR